MQLQSKYKKWGIAAVIAAIILGSGIVSAQSPGNGGHGATSPSTSAFPSPSATSTPLLVQGLPDFSPLVEAVGPSVVNIRTMARVRVGTTPDLSEMSPEMREFFQFFFDTPMPDSRATPRHGGSDADEYMLRPSGVGSGFLITPDGYIMTNAHVVSDASEIIVTLPDQREFTAQVVGADTRTDVAVVKIDGVAGLPVVHVGRPESLKVGEWVVAIGSPFGLENSVTAGIVSAKQRDTGEYINFIQTDVAINPGNSGGPLINMRGEVVGINSQIYSRSGGFMGISFSIPIDEAMAVAQQLRDQGFVERGRIAVQITPTTKEVAQAIGLGEAYGATVNMVEPQGPAAKAGVQPGDIITEVNGVRVARFSDLPRVISNMKPGTNAELKLFRRGEWKTVTVTIEAIPSDESGQVNRVSEPPQQAPTNVNRLGISVGELTPVQKQELGVNAGVVIRTVNVVAARTGLREGDVILALGKQEIENVKQFNDAVSGLGVNESAVLLVRRGNVVQYVVLSPSRR